MSEKKKKTPEEALADLLASAWTEALGKRPDDVWLYMAERVLAAQNAPPDEVDRMADDLLKIASGDQQEAAAPTKGFATWLSGFLASHFRASKDYTDVAVRCILDHLNEALLSVEGACRVAEAEHAERGKLLDALGLDKGSATWDDIHNAVVSLRTSAGLRPFPKPAVVPRRHVDIDGIINRVGEWLSKLATDKDSEAWDETWPMGELKLEAFLAGHHPKTDQALVQVLVTETKGQESF